MLQNYFIITTIMILIFANLSYLQSYAIIDVLETENATTKVMESELSTRDLLLENISKSINQNNLNYKELINVSEDILNELQSIRQKLNQDRSQDLKSNTIVNMTEDKLEKIIQDKTDQINSTLWKSAALSDFMQISLTLLGFALGLIGAFLIELAREQRSKKDIIKLLKDDLIRIQSNIQDNLSMCTKLANNAENQHEFLSEIKTSSDIINFQKLGANQEFNFWHTIISSTMLIKLKKDQIKNTQIVYDLLKKYNDTINSIMYAYDPTSNIRTFSTVPACMELILNTRSKQYAHKILNELCLGLIPIHNSYLDIIKTALSSLKIKEKKLSSTDEPMSPTNA